MKTASTSSVRASYPIGFINNVEQGDLPNKYKCRAVIARSHKAELYLIPMTAKNLILLQKSDMLRVRYWDGVSASEKIIPRPSACYDLSSSRGKKVTDSIVSLMESRGTSFVSDRKLRRKLATKWEQYCLLESHGVPTPKTALLTTTSLLAFLKKFKTLFIKPAIASQGQGQVVIRKKGDKFSLSFSGKSKKLGSLTLNELLKKIAPICSSSKKYLVQEGIQVDRIGKRVYDFRIVCQKGRHGKGEVTGCYMRIGSPKSHQANIGQKGHPQDPAIVFEGWEDLRMRIYDIALKVFTISGLGEAGIDIVTTKEGEFFCIEINARPGGKGFQMMREWVTQDRHHKKRLVLRYEYSDTRRAAWGKRLHNFRSRPILYCMHLIDQKKAQT